MEQQSSREVASHPRDLERLDIEATKEEMHEDGATDNSNEAERAAPGGSSDLDKSGLSSAMPSASTPEDTAQEKGRIQESVDRLIDKLAYVLCCVYCRAPDVAPEVDPEEEEERRRTRLTQVARAKEMQRLENERIALGTITVMYSAEKASLTRSKEMAALMILEEESEEGNVNRRKNEKLRKLKALHGILHRHDYGVAVSVPDQVLIHISNLHTPEAAAKDFTGALFSYFFNITESKIKFHESAIKIQLALRTMVAKRAYTKRLVEKALRHEKEMEKLESDRRAWEAGYQLFLKLCNAEARRVAHTATAYWRIPAASVLIQKNIRAYRVRVRFPNFRTRVLAQRKRRLERARYLAALELVYSGRAEDRLKREQVERIKYARKDKGGFSDDRGGWKPNYDITGEISIWDHVWKPPEGSKFGVRNLKVKLPPRSLLEAKIAVNDQNAWLAVPVIVDRVESKERTLGAPDRPTLDTKRGFEHVKSTIPKPNKKSEVCGSRDDNDKYYKMRYNWIPANIVKSDILDTTLKGFECK